MVDIIPTLSGVTLNVNVLNASIKYRDCQSGSINETKLYIAYKKSKFKYKERHTD